MTIWVISTRECAGVSSLIAEDSVRSIPVKRLAFIALLAAAAACENAPYVIDEFPISIDLDAGVPILLARSSDIDGVAHAAVIDTGSPITVLDVGSGDVGRRLASLELLRHPTATSPVLGVRARFTAVNAILGTLGSVGEGAGQKITAVVGGDVLSQVALRLDPDASQIRLFPDIAGSDEAHENSCAAVIPFILAGGGNYLDGVDRVRFPPTRIVVGMCANAAPDLPTCSTTPCLPSGQDTLLLVTTGVDWTILSRTAFKKVTGLDDATVDALPTAPVFFTSAQTPQNLHHTSIPRYAIVGHEGGRGPCTELFTRRLMTQGPCSDAMLAAQTCPCSDNQSSCAAAATVEMSQDLEVAMIEDTDPQLQALRNELRPAVADIDGLLGMSALRSLVTDIDYPNQRAIIVCDGAVCHTRPSVADQDRVADLRDTWKCPP
jgi:hypothetical protein